MTAPRQPGPYGHTITVVVQVTGEQPTGTVSVANEATVLGTATVTSRMARSS